MKKSKFQTNHLIASVSDTPANMPDWMEVMKRSRLKRKMQNRVVVLALPDMAIAAVATGLLRQRGWTVWHADSGQAARRLAARHFPAIVVLSAEGETESGYLTCAKLKLAQPRLRVLIVGSENDPMAPGFAEFVQAAALIPDELTAGDLVAAIECETVPA